jgi:hypothetical protein
VSVGLVRAFKKQEVWMLLKDFHRLLTRDGKVGDMVWAINGVPRLDFR